MGKSDFVNCLRPCLWGQGLSLKRQGNQIAKTAFRNSVLGGEQPVIRVKGQLMPPRHGSGQQTAAQLPCICGGYRFREEKLNVGPIPGTGAFHCRCKLKFFTGFPESGDAGLPGRFIKVRRQQPCHIIFQHGIDRGHIPAKRVAANQVGFYNIRGQRLKLAVWAIRALMRLLVAELRGPFIFARRRISALSRLLTVIASGVKICPAAKHGQEEFDFLLR